jgi:hypothetical protein
VHGLAREKPRRRARIEGMKVKCNNKGLRVKFCVFVEQIRIGETEFRFCDEFTGCNEQLLTHRAMLGVMLFGMIVAQ